MAQCATLIAPYDWFVGRAPPARHVCPHCLTGLAGARQPSTVQLSHSRIRNNAAKPPQVGQVESHKRLPIFANPHGSNSWRQLADNFVFMRVALARAGQVASAICLVQL